MLLYCTGMDELEAGRGRNAAFAIGRLCDLDDGRKRLLLEGYVIWMMGERDYCITKMQIKW